MTSLEQDVFPRISSSHEDLFWIRLQSCAVTFSGKHNHTIHICVAPYARGYFNGELSDRCDTSVESELVAQINAILCAFVVRYSSKRNAMFLAASCVSLPPIVPKN
jgi:hypothetical protein